MGTHMEHGRSGRPGSRKVRKVLRQSPEFPSRSQSPGPALTHHDGEVARLMRTFQSFKQILTLFTPEQTSHQSRKLLHSQNQLSILSGSCRHRSDNTFPISQSKVTYLNLLNLDGLTLLFDSIPWVPSLKPIKFPFAFLHQMRAIEYSSDSPVFEKVQETGGICEIWVIKPLVEVHSSLCADVMVAVFSE